jgi:RNA-binding protein
MALSGKQRRFLRGLGHHLEPVVHVGRHGLDEGVIAALDQALLDHELVKIKVGQGAPDGRHEVAAALADGTGAEIAQVLGNSLLLYRRHPDKPTIKLPAAPSGGDGDDDDDDEAEG